MIIIFTIIIHTPSILVLVSVVTKNTSGQLWWINPFSPSGDQHQFSPDNIHTLSRAKVMRINKMITNEEMP